MLMFFTSCRIAASPNMHLLPQLGKELWDLAVSLVMRGLSKRIFDRCVGHWTLFFNCCTLPVKGLLYSYYSLVWWWCTVGSGQWFLHIDSNMKPCSIDGSTSTVQRGEEASEKWSDNRLFCRKKRINFLVFIFKRNTAAELGKKFLPSRADVKNTQENIKHVNPRHYGSSLT